MHSVISWPYATEQPCFYLCNYFTVPRVITKGEAIKISLSRMYATRVGVYLEDKTV